MSNMRMKHKLIMLMMAGMIIIPGSVVRNKEQYQSVSGADRRGRVFEYSVF